MKSRFKLLLLLDSGEVSSTRYGAAPTKKAVLLQKPRSHTNNPFLAHTKSYVYLLCSECVPYKAAQLNMSHVIYPRWASSSPSPADARRQAAEL
ncbi:hypothetical protein MHYP_G00233080 [Metynnis hypsauchen]